jgi:protoporphyrinogen oxidase
MKTCILGGGPGGLTAGYTLAEKDEKVVVIEKDSKVGGLSKTVDFKGYKFDLGGHRYWSKSDLINNFVKKLMGDELIFVNRISRIYFNGKYFNYPLKPLNAMFGMGIFKSISIFLDYLLVKLSDKFNKRKEENFEDWIVNRFGKTMFDLYFRDYTEKVWGIKCNEISAEWASQRIKGMSLTEAVKNAIFKKKDGPKTLVDQFMYPKLGIGRISDRMAEEIAKNNDLILNSEVVSIKHDNKDILSAKISDGTEIEADQFISSIPITQLVGILNPDVPKEVIDAAGRLTYRGIVLVNLLTTKEEMTNDTWMYIQDKDIPFGRMQQPKNWSKYLVKDNKCSLILEYFSTKGDEIWNKTDKDLIDYTIKYLEKIKFIKAEEITDGFVIKISKAYPVYTLNYKEDLKILMDYLKRFKNLQLVGRYGTFKYNNMDHSLEMGIKAAENIMGANHNLEEIGSEKEYLEVRNK